MPHARHPCACLAPTGTHCHVENGWKPNRGNNHDWQVNSIGHVSGLGHNYVIAVMSTGNPSTAYGVTRVEVASAMAWRYSVSASP